MSSSWSAKDERQYIAILSSCRKRGRGAKECKRVAARTVQKTRAKSGRTKRAVASCPRGYRKTKNGKRCYRGSKSVGLRGFAAAARKRYRMTPLELSVWRSTPKASRHTIDGEPYILELDPELGTMLVPVSASQRVRAAKLRLTPGELWKRDAAQADALWEKRAKKRKRRKR